MSLPAYEVSNPPRLFALPFDEVLQRTSERNPYAGGGAMSALVCASAVALTTMAARYSSAVGARMLPELEGLVPELSRLADSDAEAFGALLAAWRMPAEDPDRADAVAAGALRACEVPGRVVDVAAQVTEYAALLATEGKSDLRGDAMTAAYLAAAAASSACTLVRLNSRHLSEDSVERAAVAAATRAREIVRRLEDQQT